MKNITKTLSLLSLVLLIACGSSAPLTEEEQAAKYNLTVEEYRFQKEAAARMNMSVEDHMRMHVGHEM